MALSIHHRSVWRRCLVIIYILFLLCVGMPILTMELAVGRASRQSLGRSFEKLTPGSAWRANNSG
ncbi:Uncharacterised protein [Anaerobiospirillum thomasii]|uniref:Uncharacterized protein n=1 Tax=Anaerobiospirillum thomasii TaxID=179995 RepID=A0A2X0VXD3_9GAMM|nr:Uncharacterised protein [Anaerobiospirillum thomasii]